MNTKTNAVTGERIAARIHGKDVIIDNKRGTIEQVTQGRTIWNSDGSDGPCLICAPSFEDIQAMAGFPVDDEDRALVVDEEENDDTRTIGLPSNEEAEADDSEADDIEERETPYRLRDEGRSYSGEGESYAERNA
jgi:hypothetical protein